MRAALRLLTMMVLLALAAGPGARACPSGSLLRPGAASGGAQLRSGRIWSMPATTSSAPCRAGSPRSIEKAVSQWGQPNGYVLGEEAAAPSRRAALRRGHALHQECRRPAGLLAGPVASASISAAKAPAP